MDSFQRGDFERAQALCRDILTESSRHTHAHFLLGTIALEDGRYTEAISHLQTAVQDQDSYAQAHVNLGNAYRKLGQFEQARLCLESALAKNPHSPAAWCSLGNLATDTGQYDEARQHFERAIAVQPEFLAAHFNLGNMNYRLGRFEEAVRSFESVLRIDPRFALAHFNLGNIRMRQGRFEEAIRSYGAALAGHPDLNEAERALAHAHIHLEQFEAARACFANILQRDARCEEAKYFLAALEKRVVPPAPPVGYVKELFDGYADRFESHLVGELGYQLPESMCQLLWQYADPNAKYRILDLGCGTGLAGKLLRPSARYLAGVDLSPKMLEKAIAKSVYDELTAMEGVTYLSRSQQRFDVVFAADVAIYLGDLAPFLKASHAVLARNGWLLFSVEESAEEPLALRVTGRYAHSEAYLRRLLREQGYHVLRMERAEIRNGRDHPIMGLLVMAKKR